MQSPPLVGRQAQGLFKSTKKTGDYHGQMHWEMCKKWFTGMLLPNIPKGSLIVMDNAPYHNILLQYSPPTAQSSKEKIREWLERNKIYIAISSRNQLIKQLDGGCKKVTQETCAKLVKKIREIEDELWVSDMKTGSSELTKKMATMTGVKRKQYVGESTMLSLEDDNQ